LFPLSFQTVLHLDGLFPPETEYFGIIKKTIKHEFAYLFKAKKSAYHDQRSKAKATATSTQRRMMNLYKKSSANE
jgi:hypothetical protein